LRATVTVGISGSGKTTWAKEEARATGAVITNRDDLRFSLTGTDNWGQYKFKKQSEDLVTLLQRVTIGRAAEMGKDVIVADTNLDKERRTDLVDFLEGKGYQVCVKEFHVSFEEALKRNALRQNGVGKDILYRQWRQWNEYIGRVPYLPDTNLPKAVIFDIDGTLAHMVDRKPYDWEKVGGDAVDKHLQRIFWSYARDGYAMIVVSGRDGCCGSESAKWLMDNHLVYDQFFMREPNDMRKDTVVKEEIFWRHIAENYNVEAVFDDRPSVVRMWHDIGIPKVIAVADQNIEF
jgi:predicted kinase